MRKSIALKFALPPLMIGVATVGCSTGGQGTMFRPVAASAAEARSNGQAATSFELAHQARQKGDLAGALSLAEKAVESSPRDAGYRSLLGDLYLKNGRFRSAADAFRDVLILNPQDMRARFNLALAQIAAGDHYPALAHLEELAISASPADVGLAFALAGQPERAVSLLEAAARDPKADGRIRQNLALAYALAGDWQRARITASQDLSPADVGERMEQWAAFAQPASSADQVASLLDVKPVEDAGQPVRLALAPGETQQTRMAAAPPVAPVYVAPQPAEEAPAPEVQPVTFAEVSQAAPAPVAPLRKVITARIVDRPAPPSRAAAPGRFVVQLGAYDSAKAAAGAWATLQRRYQLAGRAPVTARVNMPKGVFHRLSVGGFSSQADAARTCQSIKAKGGACFVRATSGDAPVRMASRNIRKG